MSQEGTEQPSDRLIAPDHQGNAVIPAKEVARGGDLALENKAARSIKSALPKRAPLRRTDVDGDSDQEESNKDVIIQVLPPLPSAARKSHLTLLTFVFLVALPSIISSFYYFAVASNQYVSEFRFAVTENDGPTSPQSNTGALSSISSLIGGGSGSSGSSQNYVVTDYLTSPQAVEELQKRVDLRKMYSSSSIDWWSRFDASRPQEALVQFWQKQITADYDSVTGLAYAQVRAFTPEDAFAVATALVSMSENLVNQIALRPQLDAVRFADKEVQRAESNLSKARAELLAFRSKEGTVDPTTGAVQTNVALAAQLRTTVTQLQAQLGALLQQKLSADAAVTRSLRSQIAATNEQLQQVELEVSKTKEGARALADIQGQFEKLSTDLQYAQQLVITARTNLDQARASAAAQHLYLTPYVRPNFPESSTYPQRLKSALLCSALCFGFWVTVITVYRSIGDHAS